MKRRGSIITFLLFALTFSSLTVVQAGENAAKPGLRVGVFDSRAVAVAYGRSSAVAEQFKKLRADFEQARAANDSARMKELEQQGQWRQVRLHQQAFSTVGVNAMLSTVAGELGGVAQRANVSMLVSKWETPFVAEGVEIVDVTGPLVMLFHPDEQTLKVIEQMKSTAPVPYDELSLDPSL